MKATLVTALAIAVTACAGAPSNNSHSGTYDARTGQVRVQPCTPLRADELIDWATALDGELEHERSMRTDVDYQGRARCSSRERARSRASSR